jgi:hypothetical protein
MINNKCILSIFSLLLFFHEGFSQDRTAYKFGKISATDFNVTAPASDSGASVVIIADIGSTSFEGNNKGFFVLVFTRYLRVKILNKSGFSIGDRNIELFHNKDKSVSEKLSTVRGSTFNLERGLITETRLDEKSIFEETYNKEISRRKFSMPALKEGSIFDLEYTIKSPYYARLQPWTFQSEYPCLWSEYVVTVPPPFHYVMRTQGDNVFDINTSKPVFESFMISRQNGSDKSEILRLTGNSLQQRWVKKNVRAIREEPFISSLNNYFSRVSYQLNYYQWVTPEYTDDKENYLDTWSSTSKTLLADEDFGLALDHVNTWMTDVIKDLSRGSGSDEETARKVYSYVRDNFKVVEKEGYTGESSWLQSSLKDVFDSRKGNVAEINLLLVAMLRREGIKADPLILSTRRHGIASAVYPLIAEYNYVLCVANIGNKLFTLDATRPFNDFGQLPEQCYNGYGHVVNESNPIPILFSADSVYETSVTSAFITNDEKGKPSGTIKTVFGKSGSYNLRNEIRNSSEKVYAGKVQTTAGSEMLVSNMGFDSLNKFSFPLALHYDFELSKLSSGDILYFNPMLNAGYQTNPFKSMQRRYPVDMPYKMDFTYLLNMEIPAGYQVDEMPKSAKVAYNENEGLFEYLIQKNDNNIQMRVKLKLNKAYFGMDEYAGLRDFFAFVVKKESEQIVFKKSP